MSLLTRLTIPHLSCAVLVTHICAAFRVHNFNGKLVFGIKGQGKGKRKTHGHHVIYLRYSEEPTKATVLRVLISSLNRTHS